MHIKKQGHCQVYPCDFWKNSWTLLALGFSIPSWGKALFFFFLTFSYMMAVSDVEDPVDEEARGPEGPLGWEW